MKVPDALIRRLCYSSGAKRLPKLKRLLYPAPMEAIPIPPFRTPVHIAGPGRMTMYPDRQLALVAPPSKIEAGNITVDDYRWFIGRKIVQSTMSQCRFCDAHIHRADLMKPHLNAGNCKSQMVVLYTRLRKDRNCVVCDARTGGMKWGIPLCSDTCIESWKFALPDNFRYEREIFKKGGVSDA